MTARIPVERDPRSPWVKGVAAIAAYLDLSPETVGALLRSGELRGHQAKKRGTWRTHVNWMDAYLAGEEPPSIVGRRSA